METMPNKPRQRARDEPTRSERSRGNPRKPSGGTSRHPNSLANLKKWAPGQSGNPSGKSASLNTIMRQAREHAPECIERLLAIVRNPKSADRDAIQACLALLDRGLGRPIVPIFRNTGTGLPDEMVFGGGDGGEATVLIAAANDGPVGQHRKALAEELARIDAEEAEAKARSRAEVDEAREAIANGRAVSPAMKLLLETRDSAE
jgi:hypothetical protein